MTLDDFPIHWGMIFQVLTLVTIILILWQIDTAGEVDKLRWNESSRIIFQIRRATMFLEAIALIWAVIYGHNRGWQPWPPLVAFLFALDLNIASHIMVMRADIVRLRQILGVLSKG